MSARSWCSRCGHPYDGPTSPTCECAGDRPVNPHDGSPRTNLDPETRAYFNRVKALRFTPPTEGGAQ